MNMAKGLTWKYLSAFEKEWNQIAHLLGSSADGYSTYGKIEKNLFTCREVKNDFLLA
jgi:hypothetical protein